MNKVLIIVDMQNDFISGSLKSEDAFKIIPNIVSKIKEYQKNNNLIIVTQDTHDENYLNTQEGRNLPIPHCLKNSFGHEIQKDIKEALQDDFLVFEKKCFGSLELANWLKDYYNYHPDLEIELVGVCTDICVISNAILIKNFLSEVKVIVDSKCCSSVTLKSHNNALEAMKMCQIIVI